MRARRGQLQDNYSRKSVRKAVWFPSDHVSVASQQQAAFLTSCLPNCLQCSCGCSLFLAVLEARMLLLLAFWRLLTSLPWLVVRIIFFVIVFTIILFFSIFIIILIIF